VSAILSHKSLERAPWRASTSTRAKRYCGANNRNRVTTLMHDLIDDPQNFSKHVNRATASFSSIALFGQRATSQDDFWATVSLASGKQ
jgi:hypothetical protein